MAQLTNGSSLGYGNLIACDSLSPLSVCEKEEYSTL